MADGSAVRLNGITIGYLNKLRLTDSRDPKRTVEFDMTVQSKYLPQIPVDSVAGIAAANLLGDKFINITKGSSTTHVRDGAELTSLQAQDIRELMAQSATLLQSFQTIVTRADKLLASVSAGHGTIGKLLNDEELYARLNGIASEGQKLLSDVRDGHGTLSKLLYDDTLYQQLQSPVKRMDAILAELQRRPGTAGKILKDPTLFNDAHESLQGDSRPVDRSECGQGHRGQIVER